MIVLQDWKNEAQKIREDLDTGVIELWKHCQKCSKSFSREDIRYHEKSCGNSTCMQCGVISGNNRLRNGKLQSRWQEMSNSVYHSEAHFVLVAILNIGKKDYRQY